MFASAGLTDFDWALIGAHADEEVTLRGLMLEADPERAEAFLHAMPLQHARAGT